MLTNCPYCGTPLKETTYDRLWCPNCGIVQDEKQEEKEKGDISYIG